MRMLNICKGLLVSLSQVVKGLMALPTKGNIFKIPSKLSGVVQEDFVHGHLEFGRQIPKEPLSRWLEQQKHCAHLSQSRGWIFDDLPYTRRPLSVVNSDSRWKTSDNLQLTRQFCLYRNIHAIRRKSHFLLLLLLHSKVSSQSSSALLGCWNFTEGLFAPHMEGCQSQNK